MFFSQADDILSPLDSKDGIARVAMNRANVYAEQQNFDEALALYNRALELYRGELQSLRGEADTLLNRSILYQDMADLEAARVGYHEAQGIYQKIGDRLSVSHVYLVRGTLLYLLGDLEMARQSYEKSLLEKRSIDPNGAGTVLPILGLMNIDIEQDRLQDARIKHKEIQEYMPANINLVFARLFLETGDLDEAIKQAESAADRYEDLKAYNLQFEACGVLANAYWEAGNIKRASESVERALNPLDSESVRDSETNLQRLNLTPIEALLKAEAGEVEGAILLLDEAIAIAKRKGFSLLEFELRLARGTVNFKFMDPDVGKSELKILAQDAEIRDFVLIARKAMVLAEI